MDDDLTAGYEEPCAQCSAVNWGISDEDRFFCKSCHNVIERTKEVLAFDTASSRVSTLGSRRRHRRPDPGRQWVICEAFQFILRSQANALLTLGVSAHFKEHILCQMWRLYLQRSGQAFTELPVRRSASKRHHPPSNSDTVLDSETDEVTDAPCSPASNTGSCSDWSQCSGSEDAASYLSAGRRRSLGLMDMTKTLALIHLALIWSRQPLTLSDLLSLVKDGLVPYVSVFEGLPEDMKLEGKDLLIFRVQSVPSQPLVHHQAQSLIHFLELPTFPPITRQLLLHPALLSLRYLSDANLPDELHPWVCRLMDESGLDQLTFDPVSCPILPQYDVLTAAIIIVTMKLMFCLDDHTEWDLNKAGNHGDTDSSFNLWRWFSLTQAALSSARQERRHLQARKRWTSKKILCSRRDRKAVVMKRKRTAEQLQMCFEKVSSRPVDLQLRPSSSFRFCWGGGVRADGPSLYHLSLDPALTLDNNIQTLSNATYWNSSLRKCPPEKCRCHFGAVEPTLPRSFVWLLQLFSFLLDISPAHLYQEVLYVERRILARRTVKDRLPRARNGSETCT